MSDEEDQSDVEESQPDVEESGPSEAELALKKRREAQRQVSSHGLDEAAKELLATNQKDRERMEDEIKELRSRNAKRKTEREQLDKRLAAQRGAEEDRRRAVEEEKKRKKEEEEQKRQQARAQKQAEFEKIGTGKRNFVISTSRKDDDADEEEEAPGVVKKSKEQLEAEKKAILKQRIQPLGEVSGFDKGQLADKAKELHKAITKLEGEKYDLEKRYKVQQVDMMELAERARQANKVGKGGLKRVAQAEEIDNIQARFAGAPAKIEMFSKYERQKDKRSYSDRHKVHAGPQYLRPPSKINPTKIVKWGDDGLPRYEEIEGAEAEAGGHE